MIEAKRLENAAKSRKPSGIKLSLRYMDDDGEDPDLRAEIASNMGLTPGRKMMVSAFDARRPDGRFAMVIGISDGHMASPLAQMALNRACRQYPDFKNVIIVQMVDLDTAEACVAWHARENPAVIGSVLFFACSDAKMIDRVSCPLLHDRSDVELIMNGKTVPKRTPEKRQEQRAYAANVYRDMYGETPETEFVNSAQTVTMDWTFEVEVDGKTHRVLVLNGLWSWDRKPGDAELRKVGTDTICVAQINAPITEGRSAVCAATVLIEAKADGVVLWARNKEIYNSIISDFVNNGIATAPEITLPIDWKAEKVVLIPCEESANG